MVINYFDSLPVSESPSFLGRASMSRWMALLLIVPSPFQFIPSHQNACHQKFKPERQRDRQTDRYSWMDRAERSFSAKGPKCSNKNNCRHFISAPSMWNITKTMKTRYQYSRLVPHIHNSPTPSPPTTLIIHFLWLFLSPTPYLLPLLLIVGHSNLTSYNNIPWLGGNWIGLDWNLRPRFNVPRNWPEDNNILINEIMRKSGGRIMMHGSIWGTFTTSLFLYSSLTRLLPPRPSSL